MTIKQQYRKARQNYLARVRNLEKAGYQVERIPVPKNPTRASINRLNKLTSKALREKAPLVDILTGEIEKPRGRSQRRQIETRNKKNRKFISEIERGIRQPIDLKAIPQAIDITINNLYESIDSFIPPLQRIIKERLDELVGDGSKERKEALAKTIKENPDYLPTPMDSSEATITYKFAELQRILNLNLEELQRLEELAGTDYEEVE